MSICIVTSAGSVSSSNTSYVVRVVGKLFELAGVVVNEHLHAELLRDAAVRIECRGALFHRLERHGRLVWSERFGFGERIMGDARSGVIVGTRRQLSAPGTGASPRPSLDARRRGSLYI